MFTYDYAGVVFLNAEMVTVVVTTTTLMMMVWWWLIARGETAV